MKIYKENNFSIKELENKQNKSLIDNNDVSFGISMFIKSGNFKYQINQKNNFNEHKSSIVIKGKLYSITINEEDITFRPFLKKNLKQYQIILLHIRKKLNN